MKKDDFLQMMWQDNETESEPNKTLYADVIECMDIALSQSSDTYEVPENKTVKEAYALIEKRGKESKARCVGPFEAAEILAEYLGTKYVRPSRKLQTAVQKAKINLEDFL